MSAIDESRALSLITRDLNLQEGKGNSSKKGHSSELQQVQPNLAQSSPDAGKDVIEPNDLLKQFFQSQDKTAVAEEYSASLSEKFFVVLDSFMSLVSYTTLNVGKLVD